MQTPQLPQVTTEVDWFKVAAVILGLLNAAWLYIFKRHVRDDDKMRDSFEAHVSLYNQTPNTMLLAEIRNLSSNLEDKHEANTNMIAAANAQIGEINKQFIALMKEFGEVKGTISASLSNATRRP